MPLLPILVFNGGSSSIKFAVFEADGSTPPLFHGEAAGIGTPEARLTFHGLGDEPEQRGAANASPKDLASFGGAVHEIAATLDRPGVPKPSAIGHRLVHSGPRLSAHQRVTPEVFRKLKQAVSFAPLHEPVAIEIINHAMRHFPGVPNYACFDTVFHQSMPAVASTYPVSRRFHAMGVRRYGFHGLSYESIIQRMRDARVPDLVPAGSVPARLIIAHLGNGASISAIRDGKSIDTTMGLTPCGGILMGTRSGDIDPGLVFFLARMHGSAAVDPIDAVEDMLNKHSGLLALSGLSNDMRVLRAAAARGDARAKFAIHAFAISARKAIGGFAALMGGVDALVFTGGIGEHDAMTRGDICDGLSAFGITIDPKKNKSPKSGPRRIDRHDSNVAIYVLPAEEDRMIATHVANMRRRKKRR